MKKIIVGIIFTTISLYLFSQNDTIVISEEVTENVDQENKHLVKYFQKDTERVKQLWKINVIDWGRLNPSIDFEKKVLKNIALELGAKYSFSKYIDISKRFDQSIVFSSNLRYYYNNSRRLKKGRNINGFSGNYISIGFAHGYSQDYYKSSGCLIIEENQFKTINKCSAMLGFQRRIGGIGYCDLAAGMMYSNYETPYFDSDVINAYSFSPAFKIAIGFAKSSFKRKKVKL